MDTKGTAVSPAGSVGASKCHRHFEVATGDPHPLAVVSKGGGAALAGGIQWRAAPLSGRKNPMKPAVSWHTTLSAKSSVLYLWRPWVAERGCSGREQALSASHRTGGFCVLPDEKPRSLLKAESACSGVGGAAKWKGKAKRSLVMELHRRGSQRDIKPAAASLLLK